MLSHQDLKQNPLNHIEKADINECAPLPPGNQRLCGPAEKAIFALTARQNISKDHAILLEQIWLQK